MWGRWRAFVDFSMAFWFVWSWAISLKFVELFKGSGIGAVERAFVTHEQREGLAAIGEVAEEPGDAVVVVEMRVGFVDGPGGIDGLELEEVGFELHHSSETPSSGGHGFDGVKLGNGGGFELGDVSIAERGESPDGFVGEDDGSGAESVAECVLGGFAFAFAGGGAAGFGSVGSGGFGFFAAHGARVTRRW